MEKHGKSCNGRTKRPDQKRSPEIKWEKVIYSLFERVVEDHPSFDGNTVAIKGAIRARDWEAVIEGTKARPPQSYADKQSYFAACQVEHLFKKLPIPGSEKRAEEAAWNQFKRDEHRNRRTNLFFRTWAACGYVHKNDLYNRLLKRMQFFVERVLGPYPDFGEIARCCDFGPGSSVGVGGFNTHPYAKMDTLTVSAGALPYLIDAIWENHQWRELYLPGKQYGGQENTAVCEHPDFYASKLRERDDQESTVVCIDPVFFASKLRETVEVVGYNKIDFVDKNYRTKRTTAGEPVGNGYLQIGAGDVIANRLRRYRSFLNIWDQSRNQELARLGSLCDDRWPLATLDMKSASQSLVTEMVRAVFARVPEWFFFLERIRSRYYTSKHGDGKYELFVSMGNGFCFPLQTMIFAAAVEAVQAEVIGESLYGVYGDDIIVNQSMALLLIDWLKKLGVRTNTDKSFVFGPFRESCGADFYLGENVRPYVLDFIPRRGRDLVKIANGFTVHAGLPSWRAWWGLWKLMPSYCRKTVRPFHGPDDTGLTVPVTFYELHKLDEYDAELQRSKLKSFATRSIQDTQKYYSGSMSGGQMLLALRGATPKQQKKVREGRDSPVETLLGSPTPTFRRKTKSYIAVV